MNKKNKKFLCVGKNEKKKKKKIDPTTGTIDTVMRIQLGSRKWLK
jgi:hypothetical protein